MIRPDEDPDDVLRQPVAFCTACRQKFFDRARATEHCAVTGHSWSPDPDLAFENPNSPATQAAQELRKRNAHRKR